MMIFDRVSIKVVAGAGLCGAAIALTPNAAATPLITGGYACMQGQSGEAAPLVPESGTVPAAGGPVAGGGLATAGGPVAGAGPVSGGGPVTAGACTASAPLTDMAGVPRSE